ncbi:MAG: RIP metalloprotease, partial [SAR202 cluster bacterium]|nr:RIP metalloprotease [SAR202 cluster bacterium]
GGFVRMVGEEDPTDPRSFARQAAWKRATVLVAGAFMNLVVPVVIFTILLMLPHDELVGGSVIVSAVAPGSPAQQAGLRGGDTIISVNGEAVSLPSELVSLVRERAGEPVRLSVRRGSIISGFNSSPEFAPIEEITVIPRDNPPSLRVVETVTDPATEVSLADARRYDFGLEVGDVLRQGAIGVTIGLANPRVERVSDPIWEAFPGSFQTIGGILSFTRNGISNAISSRTNPGVSGPIGIAQATGEIVSDLGVSWVFQLTALLSISLAIFNILPIPALDGGRLLFVIIEWVRGGKRISPQKEGLAHLVGFLVLIGLIIFISYFDILRLVNGESILR